MLSCLGPCRLTRSKTFNAATCASNFSGQNQTGERVVMSAENSEPAENERRPWGIWATAGLSLITYLVFVGAGIGVLIAVTISYLTKNPEMDHREFAQIVASDWTVIFGGVLISASLGILLVIFFIKIRKKLSITEYLCLYPVPWKTVIIWIALTLAFVACSDALSYVLDRPIIPEFWAKQFQLNPPILMVILAIIVVGPLFEEILFRGFMFAGIKESRLGARGAIVITALTWSAIHFQYDLYWIATIFVLGIFFGIARLRTNSLYLTVTLHAMVNAIAMIETSVLT